MASSTKPVVEPGSPDRARGVVRALAGDWQSSHPLQRFAGALTGLAGLALWRLRYYNGLSLLALSGVILAVGLVTSAAFFAQAVDQVMLDRELAEYSRITQRPPFAARVFAPSSPSVPLTLERAETLGEHVAGTLAAEVGLPAKQVILLADSGVLDLMPAPGDTRYTSGRPLADIALVYMDGIAGHIRIPAGRSMAETPAQDVLEVWMHSDLAARLGAQTGDRFALATANRAVEGDGGLLIQVAGFWEPADPSESYWLNDPNQTMREKLLVRREDYQRWVEPFLAVKVRTANWQVILDEDEALPARAHDYKLGFERAAAIIPKYLPDARVTAPTLSLEKFVGQQTALTTLLLGFNVPALGFLLYFLVLTSAVIAYWQRRETALLRSRGITQASILSFTLIEACLLFLVGGPLGLLLGLALARFMGYTVSFLAFA
ncbi:MAG TPA: FtsX-like permease family protein, partial [Caldilineaceae bacterium]|nr:FtsX-like permease family protein [Caldilineaceae bacterium]